MSDKKRTAPDAPWYKTWFDTPYYHTLYQNRDNSDAARFLQNAIAELGLRKGQKILDLACGKGRHARFLHEQGMDVVGVDLSPQSIAAASMRSKNHLRFEVGDMRTFQLEDRFDYVFILFTSFGYFDEDADNVAVLKQAAKHLKPNGALLIDYLNEQYVRDTLVPYEAKEIDGITFEISKKIERGSVVKSIDFTTKNQTHHYQEKVRLFTFADFEMLLNLAGLRATKSFGDYDLNAFDRSNSDRLILKAERKP